MRRIFMLFYYYVQSIGPGVHTEGKTGQYSISFKEIELCDDPGTNEIEFIKPVLAAMGNGNYNIRTNVSLHTAISEDISIQADTAVWGNGGWKKNAYNYEHPSICLVFHKYLPQVRDTLREQLHIQDCPIPEGYYEIDMPINGLKVPAFPTALYGKYSCESKLLRNETVIGCIRIIVELVPKRRGKNKSG